MLMEQRADFDVLEITRVLGPGVVQRGLATRTVMLWETISECIITIP